MAQNYIILIDKRFSILPHILILFLQRFMLTVQQWIYKFIFNFILFKFCRIFCLTPAMWEIKQKTIWLYCGFIYVTCLIWMKMGLIRKKYFILYLGGGVKTIKKNYWSYRQSARIPRRKVRKLFMTIPLFIDGKLFLLIFSPLFIQFCLLQISFLLRWFYFTNKC